MESNSMFEQKTLSALKWILGILKEKNIQYQISGGFSAKLYGSKRELHDIDIDIPENSFSDIADEVVPYIICPLQHYKDGKWDMQLMTLNYRGQEIDLGGAMGIKISNKDRTTWIACPADFSNLNTMEIEGLSISVISPERLIEYKELLDGDHQIEDIEAAKRYIASKKSE